MYYQDISLDATHSKQIHFLTTDLDIISSGALGSTEILLRSKANGLNIYDQVGEHFTGNGDVLAFGYNTQDPINGIGFGANPPEGRTPVGPCRTGYKSEFSKNRFNGGTYYGKGVCLARNDAKKTVS